MRYLLRTLTFALILSACSRATVPATVIIPIPSSAPDGPTRRGTVAALIVEATPTSLAAATSAPAPTFTMTPTEAPAQTPTATALPVGQIGPIDFSPDVNPLTGESVPDPAMLDRRPLAIKVSNYPSCVRPQSGLSLADLVFEHYAEGGATRFTAIFYSHDAPKVGSIRSARLIDLEIPAMYQSLFAFSGASPGVLNRLKEADFKDWILSPEFEPGHKAFFRVPKESLVAECQALEHTLFTSTDRLWADADAKGINQRPALTGMAFNLVPPAGGQAGTVVSLAYSAEYVRWTYSEAAGLYYRYANGARHTDTLTDSQITAANVVVVFANHVLTDILESIIGYDPRTGRGGSHSLEIQLWGTGPALVYRDGQVYSVTWLRQDRTGVLGLVDAATGQLLALKPGNTWFQLVGLDSAVTTGEASSWEIVPPRPTETP